MNWIALVRVLLEFFGPVIRKLIEDLLDGGRANLEARGQLAGTAPDAIASLFSAARARTWAWQFARRRLLTKCEEVARARAFDVAAACRGGPIPTLSLTEQNDLAAAL